MRKLHVIGLSVLAAFVLACGGAASDTGGSSGAGSAAKPDEEGNGGSTVAGIGDPVRDGKFEFVVEEVTCGVSEVGGDFLTEQAQGQFCLVTINVKNIGNEPQTFSDSAQKGFDANGNELSANTAAGLYANENADVFFTEINPGNGITGVIVFDLPQDGELVELKLHDSLFSGGVTVSLG